MACTRCIAYTGLEFWAYKCGIKPRKLSQQYEESKVCIHYCCYTAYYFDRCGRWKKVFAKMLQICTWSWCFFTTSVLSGCVWLPIQVFHSAIKTERPTRNKRPTSAINPFRAEKFHYWKLTISYKFNCFVLCKNSYAQIKLMSCILWMQWQIFRNCFSFL